MKPSPLCFICVSVVDHQVWGLELTSASRAGFLVQLTTVIVPVLEAVLGRRKLKPQVNAPPPPHTHIHPALEASLYSTSSASNKYLCINTGSMPYDGCAIFFKRVFIVSLVSAKRAEYVPRLGPPADKPECREENVKCETMIFPGDDPGPGISKAGVRPRRRVELRRELSFCAITGVAEGEKVGNRYIGRAKPNTISSRLFPGVEKMSVVSKGHLRLRFRNQTRMICTMHFGKLDHAGHELSA